MKGTEQGLLHQYQAALRDYLAGAGEMALAHAYELGRKAVSEGLGVLEMMAIHRKTLDNVLGDVAKHGEGNLVVKAEEFLAESLSPFEITHRAFREANVKLHLLSEHLQSVREEERSQIARDIHDELGQSLTCLKMDLSWVNNRLSTDHSLRSSPSTNPGNSARKPQSKLRNGTKPKRQESLQAKTVTMLKLIDRTIQTVRRLSSELRPALLDDLGLAATIEWQMQEFKTRTGIKYKLTLPSKDLILDQKRSTAIFRIFQETLTNVVRHSNATRVSISLRKKADNLILRVKDNGKGIAENEISDAKSLGVLGMRERALLLGGEVHITGADGKGTTVTVRVPMGKAGGMP